MSDQEQHHFLPTRLIEKAITITYVQNGLSAICVALVSQMFVIGFALKLGATTTQIGLMTTIPMYCVLMQLVSSVLVERGTSRRILVTWTASLSLVGWALVMAIPYALSNQSSTCKVWALIALITIMNIAGHVAANARSSWLADLVPSRRLGEFFGKCMQYGSLMGLLFSLFAAFYLDHARRDSIGSFGWLFYSTAVIGLICSLLHLPQADVPVRKHEASRDLLKMVRSTFENRALMILMAYWTVWSMQAIAGPFVATYILRDLHVPFLGLAVVTAVSTAAVVLSSSFWGRMVDRYGCRPVLIACTAALLPVPFEWIWVTRASAVYYILGPMNVWVGVMAGGIGVAVNKMLFNVTPVAGRSVQLAVWAIIVTAVAAPLPTIGSFLPGWIERLGIHSDLRVTFWASQVFILASLLMARKIREPNSRSTRELIKNIPRYLRGARVK